MSTIENAFFKLFNEAVGKCFGPMAETPLSEVDCKLLSNRILEKTGLVIGPKTIRNYSLYISNPKEARKENPSTATLDTLARYVLDAAKTNEIARKENESHYPYWFQYRDAIHVSGDFATQTPVQPRIAKPVRFITFIGILIGCTALIVLGRWLMRQEGPTEFTDAFNNLSPDSLTANGWTIQNVNQKLWEQRSAKIGHLTLFTLPGDNWGDTLKITNLLSRKINSDCFSAEAHMTDFSPTQNWQQAGILIAENESFKGKVLRLSLSYNDFFGGYQKSPEIIIQAVSSDRSGEKSIPEEIAHESIFSIDSGYHDIVKKNLKRLALKIEKRGHQIRFLYTTGEMESFAFKEVVSGEFTIEPRYIGIFAIQGVSNNETIPVYFDSFSISDLACK